MDGRVSGSIRRLFQPRGRHFLRAFLASIAYFGLNYGAGYMILSGFGVSQGLRRYVLSVLLGVRRSSLPFLEVLELRNL